MPAAPIPVTATSPVALLVGAELIASFLFPDDPKRVRRVYHLASEAKADGAQPPIFRLGRSLCARPQALLAWIAEREAQAMR
jgi:hypothetical protein